MSSPKPTPGRCAARVRNPKGEYCDKHPSKGRERCELHGGKQKRGIERHNTVTGRYSKVLPLQAAARYGELVADPTMVSLTREIGLVDLMLEESLDALYGGEQATPELFRELGQLWAQFKDARNQAQVPRMTETVEQMGSLIENGAERARQQDRVLNMVGKRKALVDSERRRLIDQEYAIPVDAFLAVIGALMKMINRLFDDQAAKRELFREVQSMVGQGNLRLMAPVANQ